MMPFARLAAAIILLTASPALADEPVVKSDSGAFIISTSMQELPLPRSGTETYRLWWLRSFYDPLAFRLTIEADGASELVVKKTHTAARGAPVELVLDKTIPISREETKALLETLEQSRFWDLATQWGGQGLDGTMYIVEGTKNGKYHSVERSSGGSIMGWALMLMNKSGEDYRPVN